MVAVIAEQYRLAYASSQGAMLQVLYPHRVMPPPSTPRGKTLPLKKNAVFMSAHHELGCIGCLPVHVQFSLVQHEHSEMNVILERVQSVQPKTYRICSLLCRVAVT